MEASEAEALACQVVPPIASLAASVVRPRWA